MSRPERIDVVVPAFNEAATIEEVVTRLRPLGHRVIVVDDGSVDATGDILLGLAQDSGIELIRHDSNRGKAAGLVAGMRRALGNGADAVISIDADLQHVPEDIPRLIEAHRTAPDALVIAARFQRRDQVRKRVPPLRLMANRTANWCISRLAGRPILDSQSGFRLYPRRLLETVGANHSPSAGFVFESEIIINAARAGFDIQFIQIEPVYRADAARPSHYRAVADTVRIGRMFLRKAVSRGRRTPGRALPIGHEASR